MNRQFPQPRFILPAIFVLAFALRLGYLIFLRNHYFFYDNPSSDVLYYRHWAHAIAQGQSTGVFWGLPLYPHFLAVLERLTLGNLFAMRILHLALGSINCILIYYLGQKLFTARVALIAALLSAVNFRLIYYDWLMMPVTLLIFLSLAIIASISTLDIHSKKREWFLAGLLIGMTSLGDGKFLIFSILLFGYLLFRNHAVFGDHADWGLWLKRIGIPLGVGICLVLSLVLIRNRIVGGQWVLITAQGGWDFYIGNNPDAKGFFENPDFVRPTHGGQDIDQKILAQQMTGKEMGPAEVSDFWAQKGFAFIKDFPADYLALLGKKAFLFLGENEMAFDLDLVLQREWKKAFDFNRFVVIVPFAILGLILTVRRTGTGFINLLLISQLFFTLIFFLIERHRSTILPFLLLYQAYSLAWIGDQLRMRRIRGPAIALVLLVSYWLLFPPQYWNRETVAFLQTSKSGPIWEAKGNYAKAQDSYQKALRLRPQDSTTWYNLANTYLAQDNYPAAINHYRQALALNPVLSDAWHNLGFAYDQTGKTALAIAAYHEVLALEPSSLDAHYQLAQIHQREQNCPEAARHWEFILSINPSLRTAIAPLQQKCPPGI